MTLSLSMREEEDGETLNNVLFTLSSISSDTSCTGDSSVPGGISDTPRSSVPGGIMEIIVVSGLEPGEWKGGGGGGGEKVGGG